MDDHRFDALTKAFAGGISRRHMAKWLAGSAAGGLLGLASDGRVAAGHKPNHCAKEGQRPGTGDKGRPKPCCPGLVEAPDGRCQPPSVCLIRGDLCFEARIDCNLTPETTIICGCAKTIEGDAFCAAPWGCGIPCTESAQCGRGEACVEAPCCPGGVGTCMTPCPTGA